MTHGRESVRGQLSDQNPLGSHHNGIGKVGISVIIPTYNRAQHLVRALESVLRQTRLPDEILIVDDGSTDNTADCLEAYRDSICLIRQANQGVAQARSRGVREARCQWVAFLDSDDVWFPEYLQRISEAIARTGGKAEFYFADMKDENAVRLGSVWASSGFSVRGDECYVDDGTAWVMMERQPMMVQTSVFRRDTILEVGGLWERLRTGEDTHLFLRIGIGRGCCAVSCVGGELLADDITAGRLTSLHGGKDISRWENAHELWDDILKRFPQLAREFRKALLLRCAESHRNRAAISIRSRRPVTATREILNFFIDRSRSVFS